MSKTTPVLAGAVFTLAMLIVPATGFCFSNRIRCDREEMKTYSTRGAYQDLLFSQQRRAWNYKIIKTVCEGKGQQERCYAFAIIKPGMFKSERMKVLGLHFSRRIRGKSRIKIFLFDDPMFARGHASFKYEPRDLPDNARGMYLRDRSIKEEFIQFSQEKGAPWDQIKIQLEPMRRASRIVLHQRHPFPVAAILWNNKVQLKLR